MEALPRLASSQSVEESSYQARDSEYMEPSFVAKIRDQLNTRASTPSGEGHESEVFSQVIQHMQQEWDQAQANQAAHAIITSISISMALEAVLGAPNPTVESAYDLLAPSSNDSGN